MRKCCGTCGWHKYDDDVDFTCSNEESDGYGEYTMFEDCCDCWEGRDERQIATDYVSGWITDCTDNKPTCDDLQRRKESVPLPVR